MDSEKGNSRKVLVIGGPSDSYGRTLAQGLLAHLDAFQARRQFGACSIKGKSLCIDIEASCDVLPDVKEKEIKELEKTKPVLANLEKRNSAKQELLDKFMIASQLRKKPAANPKKIIMPECISSRIFGR